ncbi:hypothetical protein J2Z31_001849 [Sinorhizobium kostiense]|uniref:Uncharacterized protein n=1 Tax=Sinorhizobium kostiense TaxID=76747 RepID=A0ABS4QXI1_9HYPH|nr:hypothetical protein [Sinorhizobium kostiense]MBP2235357.1 hypothetical protein [Sinorhizobium kostiense]
MGSVDEVDLFVDERGEELQEAFDAFLRELDEVEGLEDVDV